MLPFNHWLIVLSAIISVVGCLPYIRDTYIGKTKPNRVSWLMWALFPLIGTAAAYDAGADIWASLLSVLLVLPSVPVWTVENCVFRFILGL